MHALSIYAEFLEYQRSNDQVWPLDRIRNEAHVNLNRFLNPLLAQLERVGSIEKKIVIGAIAEQIARVAEESRSDLIVMAPKRRRSLKHYLGGSITDRVTRRSPCPVLSVMPPMPSRNWRGTPAHHLFRWPRPQPAGL